VARLHGLDLGSNGKNSISCPRTLNCEEAWASVPHRLCCYVHNHTVGLQLKFEENWKKIIPKLTARQYETAVREMCVCEMPVTSSCLHQMSWYDCTSGLRGHTVNLAWIPMTQIPRRRPGLAHSWDNINNTQYTIIYSHTYKSCKQEQLYNVT